MRVIATFICWCFVLIANAQRCGTAGYVRQYNLPTIAVAASRNMISDGRDTLNNEVIVIPVVIHVLYHNSVQNISDEEVLSQLTALNNDYRRLNADTLNTPAP